jgi:hypothetical protein
VDEISNFLDLVDMSIVPDSGILGTNATSILDKTGERDIKLTD